MTWVQHFTHAFLSLSPSLSHDVLSLLFQSNCSISQDLLLLAHRQLCFNLNSSQWRESLIHRIN